MNKMRRQTTSTRQQKASNPSIRPLKLPRLVKNTSRLIDIERELQEVRQRLYPLMEAHGINKKEYNPVPYRPRRRKRKSCNTQFAR